MMCDSYIRTREMPKSDLNNLQLRLRHVEPTQKARRTLTRKVTELTQKFGSYPTAQLIEIFNAVLSNLGRDVSLTTEKDTEFDVLKCLKSLKGTNSAMGCDLRAILTLTMERELKKMNRDQQRELGIYHHVWVRVNEIRDRVKEGNFFLFTRREGETEVPWNAIASEAACGRVPR